VIKIDFPNYSDISSVSIPKKLLIDIVQPRIKSNPETTNSKIIKSGLEQPINSPSLKDLIKKGQKILIIVDDYTRTTPTNLILPILIEELLRAGISRKEIKLLVASGTHREMSHEEKKKKYGKDIVNNYEILDHNWRDDKSLVKLDTTKQGTEIWINKEVLKADFVIGIGQIVPHRVAGFSGGSKIIQPGVCGPITTGQTHWLSAKYEGCEIIGKIDNPIRQEINEIGEAVGLKFIVNTICDGLGNIFKCVCGEPVKTFEEGCKSALDIYGVPLTAKGDIVIVDSFPADIELWQAAKGIYSGDLALKPDGVLILVSPCTEGVSAEYPNIIDIGYRSFPEIEDMVENGKLINLTLAAHLAHVGRVIQGKRTGILVSPGIPKNIAEKLGFYYAKTVQVALELALKIKDNDAKVVVIKNGGSLMPIIK
jgi:nickel-dependent lactate racemase